MQEGLREPQGVRKVCKDTQRINGDGGRKSSWGVMRQFSREKDMYKGSFEMWRVRHVQSTSRSPVVLEYKVLGGSGGRVMKPGWQQPDQRDASERSFLKLIFIILILFFNILATPCSTWHLSFPTRD